MSSNAQPVLTFKRKQRIKLVFQFKNNEERETVIKELKRLQLAREITIVSQCNADIISIIDLEAEELSEQDYQKIKNRKDVAIIGDSESMRRTADIMQKIYTLETQLRALALCIPNITTLYYEILCGERKVNNYEYGQVTTKELDALTNHLTLGELTHIFGCDVSLCSTQVNRALIVADTVIRSKNYENLQKALSDKMKPRYIWDIATEELLEAPVLWRDIRKDFQKLCAFRNNAAHFHIITGKEHQEFLKLTERLLKVTEIKTNQRVNSLKELQTQIDEIIHYLTLSTAEEIAQSIKATSSTFAESYQKIFQDYIGKLPNEEDKSELPSQDDNENNEDGEDRADEDGAPSQ